MLWRHTMATTYGSLVGLIIGHKYEVHRMLGTGGMGVVCEAVHLELGKKVAIKLIDEAKKDSEVIIARFRREARALGQIKSEHIVDVFDVGADDRLGLYMVMEHLVGEDLHTRLERDKRLDIAIAVDIGHQIARALQAAHGAEVIHRDLKPANVFLTSRENGSLLVKLLDFGVSKILSDRDSSRITRMGGLIGTPLYMSPEQAEGKVDSDGRADIWSLGAVLYEALAGKTPFACRGNYASTIVGVLTTRPQPLHEAAPWVPAKLASIVDAMLVHEPAGRIRDAATVTERLLAAYPLVNAGTASAANAPISTALAPGSRTESFSRREDASRREEPNDAWAPARTGVSTGATSGSSSAAPLREPKVQVRAAYTRILLNYFDKQGGDAAALCQRHGIDPHLATRICHSPADEVALPFAKILEMTTEIAAALDDPFVGLHVAVDAPRASYGIVELTGASAPTMGVAIDNLIRYQRIFNNVAVFSHEEREEGVALEHRLVGITGREARQLNEYSVGMMVRQCRDLSRSHVVPLSAWFTNDPPRDTSELIAYLGTSEVAFNAASNGVLFAPGFLGLEIPAADDAVHRLLDRYAHSLLPAATNDGDLLGNLEEEIRRRVRQGADLEVEEIASAMHMSVRTLQRRLRELDTSFNQVLDDARRAAALHQVSDGKLAIGEIAFLLGYSEARAFLRAFKRWTGLTVQQYRQR